MRSIVFEFRVVTGAPIWRPMRVPGLPARPEIHRPEQSTGAAGALVDRNSLV